MQLIVPNPGVINKDNFIRHQNITGTIPSLNTRIREHSHTNPLYIL